jgi:CubicO group peptidase (beta-lactamase class C family)
MRYTRLLLLFLVGLNLHAFCQHKQDTAIDAAVEKQATEFMANKVHTGLSIGLITNSRHVTWHYGHTDKQQQQRPTANTIYEIASLTKSFTGILLAYAVLERKLSLDDDIRKYLPGHYPNLTYKGQPIRIIHLANHTAGLHKFLPALDFHLSPAALSTRYKDYSKADFLTDLKTLKIDTFPGTRFGYSNIGTQLIGVILENVYRKSYGALVEQYITGPCHMTSTRLQLNKEDSTHLAKGYDKNGQLMPELSFWRNVPAAGYLKSTTADLLKYIQFNMDDDNPAIALAHKATFMHTDEDDEDIGLCWFSKEMSKGGRKVDHAGGSFGFTSYCLMYPSLKLGVVCLANDADPGTERQLRKMAAEILNTCVH